MTKSTELDYINNFLNQASKAMLKPKSYAAFYFDSEGELHIYECGSVHKLKESMDNKHPDYELMHVEHYPDSATPRNLVNAARMIREARTNLKHLRAAK